jgi:hypothetical protein
LPRKSKKNTKKATPAFVFDKKPAGATQGFAVFFISASQGEAAP